MTNKNTQQRFRFLNVFFGLLFGKRAREASRGVMIGSHEIAEMARRLYDLGVELSSSNTEQAAALQEASSSADEVNAMVNKNAENAKRSQETSAASLQAAQRGKQTVEELVASIAEMSRSNREIVKQIEDSNRQFNEVVKLITEIGTKTKVINDIVFQTKLLSFNASVEAARAGEHGKGFAVVAEEVGNLAQMSGNAAKEISLMLDSSIQRVEAIVVDTSGKVSQLMTLSQQTVDKGTATASRCGQVLDAIVAKVAEVNELVSEIATASREQSTGINEISKTVAELDRVMQRNTIVTQETAGVIQRLRARSEHVGQLVRVFSEAVQADHENVPQAVEGGGKVIPMQPHARQGAPAPRHALEKASGKMAVGAEQLPSRDDSRFEEV